MITIRQSAIADYEQCPFLYYDTWGKFGDPDPVQEENEVTNKYAMAGTAFHAVMDEWAKHAIAREDFFIEDAEELLVEEYAKIPDKVFDDEEDLRNMFQLLVEQLHWIWDKYLIGIPLASEKEFYIEDLIPGLPPFSGTIDRIDGSHGLHDLQGIDYKTGKVFTKKDLMSNVQATIYALAIERMYGVRPRCFTFIFSKFRKVKDIYISDYFLDMGKERIKNVWYHIVNEDFNPKLKPNKYFCRHFCTARPNCPKFRKPPKGWEEVELP